MFGSLFMITYQVSVTNQPNAAVGNSEARGDCAEVLRLSFLCPSNRKNCIQPCEFCRAIAHLNGVILPCIGSTWVGVSYLRFVKKTANCWYVGSTVPNQKEIS